MSQAPKTRNWWPIGIVAGLGVVFVANAIMITLALRNPSVMASEDPYGDALDYDRVIAERAATAALGWQVEFDVCTQGPSPAPERGCVVTFTVRDRDGHAVEGLSGAIEARRGDDAALDRVASVSERGEGRYEAVLALARPGLYELSVHLDGGPSPWVASFSEMIGGASS